MVRLPMARIARRRALFALALVTSPTALVAQSDTLRTAADSARRIERVLVTAIRAAGAAPIAEKTLARPEIVRRQFGQDVPLLLQGIVPSLTAHTETGTSWGYSYLRLRGMDQTRLNITLDGIPLNDMEDQVLYFANFADLMSGVQSVQVQRGVGTSSAGTASFAGSLNFETMPVGRATPGGDLQLQAGAFGSQRISGSFHTGLRGRFAAYGRAGAVRTNGYRDHSCVRGGSALLGAGWFGDRDIIKLTALDGELADTLSYVGATRAELAANRRYNPLQPGELDRFGQRLLALSWTRIASPTTSFSTTVYRNAAAGSYDYFDSADRYRFNLDHWWVGLTSAVNATRGAWQFNAGVNGNTYARDHRGYLEPTTTLYENTGEKQDASAFVKAARQVGRARWFADLQGRVARFRYVPDENAGIPGPSIDWAFLNPKGGVTVALGAGLAGFASVGRTSREPARSDLLAGDDDLNATNVADYGDFSRVKPESVIDTELGFTWTGSVADLSANLYSMDFRNDIARIGAPTASGAVLRRNVGASYRRGLELDGRWRVHPRVTLGGNASWSTNRIRSFTDSSRGAPVVRRNVAPVLTPRFIATQEAEWTVGPRLTLGAEWRHQSRAYLDNTQSADRVLPAFHVLDATARTRVGRLGLTVRGVNLADSDGFGSGSVSSSGTVRYFVLPARAVYVTAEVSW